MDQNPAASSLFPPQPIPEGADAFSRRVHTLLDGRPKDEAAVAHAFDGMDAMFDRIAAGLYNLASMLVGEGEESVRLVETAVATADIAPSHSPLEGRKNSRLALARAALQAIERNHPGSLAAPAALQARVSCIEDDELDSTGVSAEELTRMIAGPDRDRVREWLAGLPISVRTVFTLRAVAGFTAPEAASLLAANGGPSAAGQPAQPTWTHDAVRELFRQGLCSLASQLLHASTAR
jgi:DNA-directed RNA polymerase specialized sigma24 family protein